MEQFQIAVSEEDLVKFGIFRAAAAGQEAKIVEMKTFTVNKCQGEPSADNEVEEIAWVTSKTNLKLGSIFEHEVIAQLVASDLID